MSGDDFELYGTRERAPISRTLTVGRLSVTLEDGNLRMLRYAGHEVLRGIAFLVRDKDWGTCTAAIRDLIIDEQPDGFSIRYHARFSAPDGANLDCAITISGGESHLSYSADYMSDADFETARTGFAVLHPIAGTAGQPVEVRHTDGSVEQANWPDAIEPWQPFKEIAAITHGVTPGIRATTAFSGDVFEMEDQRNWTDGSYKTYVRPLELPWPYRIGAGELFSHSVTVTIAAEPPAAPALVASGAVAISSSPTEFRLAEIGVGLRSDCLDEERAAIEVLEKAGARHLIAHFDPGAGHELEVLQGYAEIAARSGLRVTLETAVLCTRPLEEELSEIAALVALAGLPLDTLFVCPSVDRQSTPPGSRWPDCPPLADVYAAARAAFPGIRLGGGMMSYFTELNRKRVPADHVDYISHATNPIVHAADDLSVMQSFEALADVVASVRALYGNKPYRIGPSTIAMRQNPYGSATKDNPGLGRIPMANVDPRHNGQFGAAWTLAYAATVASAGLEVLTLSTLAGPFGLVAGMGEPVASGRLRPLAQVIARLGALSGQVYHAVEMSRRDIVRGLGTADRLLLANITPETQQVALDRRPLSITALSALGSSVPPASEFALSPYECVEIVLG